MLWALIAAFSLIVVFFAVRQWGGAHPDNNNAARAASSQGTHTITWLDTPRPVLDVPLQRADIHATGQQLQLAQLRGHYTLVFIGFTYCPDICPTTLAQLAVAQNRWQTFPEAARPRVLFVSVDPERDSLERIGQYSAAFHPDTFAATADIPSLQRFTRSLSLVFMKIPATDATLAAHYTIDHSASLALINPEGQMVGLIQPPLDPEQIAADLIALSLAHSSTH